MFIVISPLNPDPLYKQVTDQIRDAIADGSLSAEEKLPSIREMSRELKISPITIKRAFSDLENGGYIITRAGMGTYVADINRQRLREEKLSEIREELDRLLVAGRRFDISGSDMIRMIQEQEK